MNLTRVGKLVFSLSRGSKEEITSTSKGWNKCSNQVTLICIIRFAKLMIIHTTIQIISSETAIMSTVKRVKCNGNVKNGKASHALKFK